MPHKVIILGGGVAGMSAAHELAERGYEVFVYEMRTDYFGGKARSIDVPGSASTGKRPLPGEHGFRFFPRFYNHINDLMKRIPYPGNADGVIGNLVDATRAEIARYGKEPIVIVTRFPKNPTDIKTLLSSMYGADTGLTPEDIEFFANKLWKIMTSCYERRMEEYEKISWWDFIEAGKRSPAYQTFFATGLTRTLVAGDPKKASTRTGGNKLLQLLFDMYTPGSGSDRVLNGPTNEVWLTPWLNYLTGKLKVKFFNGAEVSTIHCDGKTVTAVTISKDSKEEKVTGDYYISCLPVEAMAPLVNNDLVNADSALANLPALAQQVSKMHGIQFFMTQPVPLVHGHIMYMDTEWALTSISQAQFWNKFPMSQFGDGTIKDILSVDISDWYTSGILYGKAAKDCTPEEVKNETWAQLKKSLNINGKEPLKEEMIHKWYIEPGVFSADPKWKEWLLVNMVNGWSLRPEAITKIPNFFLAADYVRTHSDLASMESANEAARKAVNGILSVSGSGSKHCTIWPHKEPGLLAPWRLYDLYRLRKGEPWNGGKLNWIDELIYEIKKLFSILTGKKVVIPESCP